MTASIHTKYLGPTNHRGGRIKATASNGAGSVTVPWDHALGIDANHDAAARALARKLGWKGRVSRGGNRGGSGNVYVFHGDDVEFSRHRKGRSQPAYRHRSRRMAGGNRKQRRAYGWAAPLAKRVGKKKAKRRGRRA